MISYSTTKTTQELEQILALQQRNLPESISEEERLTEGFVTVHHHFDLLKKMHDACPHIIAKEGDKVVGYTLCMHPKFGDEIDVLRPMFYEIDNARLTSTKVAAKIGENYIVMGQVCIDRDFRRKGIFRKLYETMRQTVIPPFSSIITEVDAKNTRSLEAHYAIGFELLSKYESGNREWVLIYLK